MGKPVGPALPPKFVDPLLQNIDIRFWTNVSVTNELAAGAISLYLQTGHPILGLFDSQLFLSSLVACNTEFCSRFLVNSLLAYATQASSSSSKLRLFVMLKSKIRLILYAA